MNRVRSIIERHEPALEAEVRQYIENLVESAIEDGSEDDVAQIVSSFLSEDESDDIISVICMQKVTRGIEDTSIAFTGVPPPVAGRPSQQERP